MAGTRTVTLSEAAERLRLTPLELLTYAQILGQASDDELPETLVHVIAEKLSIPLGEVSQVVSQAPEESGDAIQSTIRSDGMSKRRVLRFLLHKMDKRGRWWPSCVDQHSLPRGLEPRDRAMVRDALDLLIKAGWVKYHPLKRGRLDAPVGLNDDQRDVIRSFVENGRTKAGPLLEWLGPAGS